VKEPQPPYGTPQKELLKAVNATKEKILHILMVDEHFNEFIEAVDDTGQGELIESLFGSEKVYIDTPGNYHVEKESFGGSAVEHFVMNCGAGGGQPDQVLAMYAWYIGNLYKVNAWLSMKSDTERINSPEETKK